MNEMEKRDIARGHAASQVMDSEVITDAFNSVRDEIRATLFSSARGDVQLRESCFHMDAALTLVQGRLNQYVARGRGVEAKLQEEENEHES